MKPFLPMPAGIALHGDRAAADVRQHQRRDRLVVGGQLALGDPVVGEQHLLGMRDHRPLPDDLARALVGAHAEQTRVTQLAVDGPLDERDLDDDLAAAPSARAAAAALRLVNGGCRISSAIERRAQSQQQLRVEAGADLAREDEVVAVEVADQQRAETDAAPCGSVKPPTTSSWVASHFIFSQCGERRCSYRRVAPLGDDAFPAFAHARSHGFASSSAARAQRRCERQRAAARALVERQRVTSRPSSHRMSKTW